MNIYLETERLRLRELTPDEGHLFYDLDSDPEVMKYLKGGETSSKEECEEAAKRCYDYYEKYGRQFGLWFAEEKSTGDYMGWFILRPDKLKPDAIGNPELGYRLKKAFWGKGYATEGSIALVEKAFTLFNCDSVFAVTMTGNLASQNVMKKLGMKYIGPFEQDACYAPGGDTSAVEYAITKEEWLNNENASS